jgi:mannobiose 2-epimerase
MLTRGSQRIVSCFAFLTTLGLFLQHLPTAAFAEPPQPDVLKRQAKRCRELLLRSIVDFYLPACLDRQHGGYFENLGPDGKFVADGDKFVVLQARHLWLFSILAENNIRQEESLAAARSGYEFLQQHFRDADRGGYFTTVADDGRPLNRRKHCYMNSFALYGLVAYFRATHDPAVLKSARNLFDILEEKAHDAEHGGYQEYFEEDWRAVTGPGLEPAANNPIGTKSYNTQLHLLESIADLCRIDPDPLIARRLAELVQIASRTVQHPDFPANLDVWTRDWRIAQAPRNQLVSYGHEVECTWLVLDADRVLNRSPRLHRQWAVSLVGYTLDHGYDREYGGLYGYGAYGQAATDLKKTWWVQCEALIAMLELYRLTGDERYYREFAQTLDFVEQHHVAKEGGWWNEVNANGSAVAKPSRASMWQCGYHSGRALLLCEQILNQLAQAAPHE